MSPGICNVITDVSAVGQGAEERVPLRVFGTEKCPGGRCASCLARPGGKRCRDARPINVQRTETFLEQRLYPGSSRGGYHLYTSNESDWRVNRCRIANGTLRGMTICAIIRSSMTHPGSRCHRRQRLFQV